MQKHSLILSGLLAQSGVEVHLVHPGGEDYESSSFKSNYTTEARANIHEIMIPWPKKGKLPGHYLRENKRYSKQIYETVLSKIDSFDFVYAQGFTGIHFVNERKKGTLKVPVLVNLHGFEMFQTPPSQKVRLEYMILKPIVKQLVTLADYVYSFGGKIDEVIERLGVNPDKVLPQANGISANWLNGAKMTTAVRTFVFIGRNERRKGIEELNEALIEINKIPHLEYRFHFIGPIPRTNQIDDDRISYHGEIRDFENIKAILLKSDCLVCPSHSEGMPTVILEGMACQLAIIATNVGAVKKQFNHNGILLENPDSTALKDAILSIINSPIEDLKIMQHKSYEFVKENFLWEVIAQRTLAQLTSIKLH